LTLTGTIQPHARGNGRQRRHGGPDIVAPDGAAGKSPGFFDCAAFMDNPTLAEVQSSALLVADWIKENQSDPEYSSFQLNFFFSGHGDIGEDGEPLIVLAGERLRSPDLASLFLSCVPKNETLPSWGRVDLYLDCCHGGAIARSIFLSLETMQRKRKSSKVSRLGIGQVYCASLDDEDSYEWPPISHSLFTFAFLNECSRKRPEGVDKLNLGLRDVGWRTNGLQHPLLLDFTTPEIAIKFPALYYLTRGGQQPFSSEVDLSHPAADPIGTFLAYAREQREKCVAAERAELRDESRRIPFSRDEVLSNQSFPFL
jgi:hypothetical protein